MKTIPSVIRFIVLFLVSCSVPLSGQDNPALEAVTAELAERQKLHDEIKAGKIEPALMRLEALPVPEGASSVHYQFQQLVGVALAARNDADPGTALLAARTALEWLPAEEGRRLSTPSERAAFHRGMALIQERVMADIPAARAAWAQVLEDDPDSVQARQAIALMDQRQALAERRLKESDPMGPDFKPTPAP